MSTTDKIKDWCRAKTDLVKTLLWNLFAPNLYKLLKARYVEANAKLDELDAQYEADLDQLMEERDEYKQKYLDLYNSIQEMAKRLGA